MSENYYESDEYYAQAEYYDRHQGLGNYFDCPFEKCEREQERQIELEHDWISWWERTFNKMGV